MSKVTLTVDDTIATITMNVPEKKNALARLAVDEFTSHLRSVQYDEDVRCVVITGAGDAFCAGADVSERVDVDSVADLPADIESNFHELIRLIMRMKKPVVAKVRGPAVGAGACIATACDFVYADEDAVMGWVFVNIGIAIDSGVSFILPRLVGLRTATELVYTGDIIGAEEAEEIGLINEAVPGGGLDDRVEERVESMASSPTRALGETKRLFLRGSHATLEETLDAEATAQGVIFHSEDRTEGMRAFGEDRDPRFEGR